MTDINKQLSDLKIPDGIGKIDEIINGYRYYSVLAAALETDLFDWLDKNGPSDREIITDSLGYNGMFTRCFLTTLEDMKLISEENELYSNTDLSEQFLLSKNQFYQGDLILSQKESSSKWKELAESIRNKEEIIAGFEEGPTHRHLKTIAQRGIRGEIQTVASRIFLWKGFSKSKKVLDIGGGHGLYSVCLCQKNPDLHAVILDKPHVVQLTSDYIEEYGMQDQISVVPGDMTIEIPGGSYDIIMMSHILYKFRKDLPSIFSRISESMNKNGLLVLNHWFCSPGCLPETGSAVNDLEKSLISFGHPLCYPDEFARILNENGFEIIEMSGVPTAYGNSTLHLAVYTDSRNISTENRSENEEICKCKLS